LRASVTYDAENMIARPRLLEGSLRSSMQKINLKKLAYLSDRKNVVPNHHISHASHHKFTIKTPRFGHHFFVNPLKKPSKLGTFTTAHPAVKKIAKTKQKNGNPTPKLL